MAVYGDDFYEHLRRSTRKSAEVIVPMVVDLIAPRSVVDVGCGSGTWLSVFKLHGVDSILGIDGRWVASASLEIPSDQFVTHDLQRPLERQDRFDLAISLEVGEHIEPEFASTFVESLVKLSDVVLFSAAIPEQGGTHHVNEQWPQYWAAHFGSHGYVLVDCLRSDLWNNPNVEFYYAQNLMLFVRSSRLEQMPILSSLNKPAPLNIVHPRIYLTKASERSDPARLAKFGVRALFPALLLAIKRAVAGRLRALRS